MENTIESSLKLFSLGIVLSNKPRNTDMIEVLPIEHLPYVDGNISNAEYKHKASSVNINGIKTTSETIGNNKLLAKWIPFGHSNRMSSPDVIANETVIIFKFADTEEYYWTTIFREPSLRRLETAHFAFSNLAKGLLPFNKDSSYWLEVSTHDQKVQFHTSKSNGESYAYDITINTRLGTININDDIGNTITLDSSNNSIDVTANSTINLTAPVVNINANTTNISNNLNVGGNISVSKSMSVGTGGGSGSISGNLSIDGSISTTGNINSSSNITAAGTVNGSNI